MQRDVGRKTKVMEARVHSQQQPTTWNRESQPGMQLCSLQVISIGRLLERWELSESGASHVDNSGTRPGGWARAGPFPASN
jgi:hypothetical protein